MCANSDILQDAQRTDDGAVDPAEQYGQQQDYDERTGIKCQHGGDKLQAAYPAQRLRSPVEGTAKQHDDGGEEEQRYDSPYPPKGMFLLFLFCHSLKTL